MKFNKKYILAYAIILFISGTAFVAGLLQENLTSNTTQIKETMAEQQTTLIRMESKAFFLTTRDISTTYKAIDVLVEVTLIDNEFDLLNATLPQAERDVYVKKIVELLMYRQSLQNKLMVVHLYRHFNTSSDDFVIALQENDGYDYRITLEMWQDYVTQFGLPVYIWNASEYYGNFFSYSVIQALPPDFRPYDPDSGFEIFIFEGGGIESIMDYFLYSQVRTLQDSINSNNKVVNTLESQTAFISLTVSLTTVSLVLSTAMITRLNHKKLEQEFEILKAKEGRELEGKRDALSIPVLIVAGILSILGILLVVI